MDRNHQLDAPDDINLKNIEQITDRSDLTTIYPHAHDLFEGKILSEKERSDAKDAELNDITRTIRKSFVKVGVLIPLPFLTGSLLAAALLSVFSLTTAMFMIGFVILAVIAWMYSSYKAYHALFVIFYNHALKAGPFLFVMLLCLMLASQGIFEVSQYLGTELLLVNILIMGVLLTLYSIGVSYLLLTTWTHPKLGGGVKLTIVVSLVLLSAAIAIASVLL